MDEAALTALTNRLAELETANAAMAQQLSGQQQQLLSRIASRQIEQISWRSQEQDGKIRDMVTALERAMDMMALDDMTRAAILRSRLKDPARKWLEGLQAQYPHLATATYDHLKQLLLNNWERAEDRLAATNKLMSLRMKKGQSLRSFCDELTELHAAVPHDTIGWDAVYAVLLAALHEAGHSLSAALLAKEKPATLAEAVALVCRLDGSQPMHGTGPQPMQLGATMIDRSEVLTVVSETVQAVLGALDLKTRTGTPTRLSFGRNRTPDRLGYRGDRPSGSRPQHSRSNSRERDRRALDPMKDPRWPAGVVRRQEELERMAAAGQCFLCRSREHRWVKCTDPQYRHRLRPNGQ